MSSPRPALAARRLALAVCALAALVACVPKDDAEVDRARQAHELARDLMSPFCPGRTLAECGSPDAGAVREEIRAELAAGESPDAIRARIEARFGDRVVGVPRERAGWVLPIVLLALGAGALALVLRRALRPGVRSAPLPPDVESALSRELEEIDPH
jgi:cytochrome c-type biogenesis protein CcmH